ncbi:MAG TPA: hypothetical protein PLE30_04870 [Candidatus Kapabacteria bacterium]|nr:hypothetical protein [Candidatus Kapabacteria bacterium]
MNSKKSTLIIVSVIISVSILSIFAYYNQKGKNEFVSDEINKQLLEPYIKLLQNSDYKQAYNEYTSSDFKRKYTYAMYQRAQDSNLTVNGKIKSLVPFSGIFVKEITDNKLAVFKGTVVYEAEKIKKNIVVEILIENGKMRLNRTYDSYLTMSNILPVIY